jgi:ATP-binding cassette subfamily B (MDR/TAP) protein 1
VFVSQEPILYRGTICENILLGIDRDNISKEEIAQRCKDANIYDFISLPSGLNALGAKKGCMLSGGQKTA